MSDQQNEIYLVQHNSVTIDVTAHKLNALLTAAQTTGRHPHNPAKIITLPRPANFMQGVQK